MRDQRLRSRADDQRPAVSNGIVYAGSSDNYFYALDAVSGALKWHYQAGNYVFSSPNVANGIVYFGCYDANIYALNAIDGGLGLELSDQWGRVLLSDGRQRRVV